MKFTFTEKDLGFDELRKLAGQKVAGKVGIVGEAAQASRPVKNGQPITNADLGLIQEFGSDDGKIPARSFIRGPFDANRERYLKQLAVLARRVYDRAMTIPQAMGVVAEGAARDVREAIRARIPPPNAASTIAQKGSSTPLIASGQLLGAVGYEVDVSGKQDPDGHRER